MITLKGKGVSGGVAFGRLYLFRPRKKLIAQTRIEDIPAELKRLEEAVAITVSQLGELYEEALSKVGEQEAAIFEIHQMMLEDDDYRDAIRNMIEDRQINVEYAVQATAAEFAEMFAQMDDPYMQARAVDVRDISGRLIDVLSGGAEEQSELPDSSVLAAEDLTPSQTLQLDKTKVSAFVTEGGSQNSHTAILARTMNLPAVVCVPELMREEYYQAEVIVDGDDGFIYLRPDAETIERYERKRAEIYERERLLEELRGKKTVTASGRKVRLYANAGSLSDVEAALSNDAEGIGLFRSEFIFLESTDYPTEEEQFQIYRQAAEKMAGRPVIIRTLDIGADKQAPYFGLAAEENPALGLRGIRICLTHHELFKTQLRAIYRASAYGKIAVMFPMIASVEEVREIKAVVAEIKQELDARGAAYDGALELGIMIETPAAAIISDELAAEVDFFSIGTNDLTQYTLAIDRQNQQLDRFYNPRHKAVLELIRMTAENAHKHSIWVGICGELAADTALTETFLELGIDELSVAPPAVLRLRRQIRDARI